MDQKFQVPIYSNGIDNDGLYGFTDEPRVTKPSVTISARGTIGFTKERLTPFFPIVRLLVLTPDTSIVDTKYLEIIANKIEFEQYAVGTPQLTVPQVSEYKIPLPPLDIQEKIVYEIDSLEISETKAIGNVNLYKEKIDALINSVKKFESRRLGEICDMKAGKFVSAYDIESENSDGLFPCYGGNGLRGYTKTFTHDGKFSLIGRQGALCGNVCIAEGKFHATEHAVVVTPLPEINAEWLHHKLLRMNLNQYATGTAQPGLSVENLKSIAIEVPLLSEQLKIVIQIQAIENKVVELENEIAAIPSKKEEVLKRYL